MIRYFDASALVKKYVKEPESSKIVRLLQDGTPVVCRISEVEVASALARRCREGAFPVAERDRAFAALCKDFLSLHVVELSPEICAAAYDLLASHPLRANDAIQLASCLYLQKSTGLTVQFIAYDSRLNDAARQEGLAL